MYFNLISIICFQTKGKKSFQQTKDGHNNGSGRKKVIVLRWEK